MKNFLPLLAVLISGCAAAAEDSSGGYTGTQGFGGGSTVSGSGGASATAGASNTLGGLGNGNTAGAFGLGGVSGQGLGSGGASATGGAFGVSGSSFGGSSFGGSSFGGSSFGGNGGHGGFSFGGSGGQGTAGLSGLAGSAGAAGASQSVCTSKKTWNSGNGLDMRPGNDCRGCHGFSIAGTVYPTLNEPNNCDGGNAAGVKVLITGADNLTLTLTPSAASGNFYSNAAIKTPYSVKLTNSSGASRSMTAHQTAGNCNSCHTPGGANGAPGRITAP